MIHKVTVDGFWMDKCPVTNKAFSEFVAATNYVTARQIFPCILWTG
jgi:formylglycine-generating enzyme